MRIHLCVAWYVLAGGFVTQLRPAEWCAVLLCFGLVLGLECVNTALEALCDRTCPERDPLIGKAKDAAAFVRQNTPYFLPKFKSFFRKAGDKGHTLSWNWSAFIFDAYYLFYRKMYGLGAAVLAVSVLLSVPSLILYFENMLTLWGAEGMLLNALGISLSRLNTLYSLSSFLSLAMKLCLATLFNRAYASHTVGTVKKLRKQQPEESGYYGALARKGGVSPVGVLAAFGVTALVSVVSSTVFMHIVGML